MKDMYSFDVSQDAALRTYDSVCHAYARLLSRLGMKWVQVQADTGNIGGTLSHEFHLPAKVGEDRLLGCPACGFSANMETLDDHQTCPRCHEGHLNESKGIEIGHTFYLGTKYSEAFNATFISARNKPELMEMGCFGLGVTRLLAASIEVLSGEEGIRWPGLLAPYQVCILLPKKGSKADEVTHLAEELVHNLGCRLPGLKGEVVLDDRTTLTIGKRMKDARLLGYPYVVVVGQKAVQEHPEFEVVCQNTSETLFLGRDALMDLLQDVETI